MVRFGGMSAVVMFAGLGIAHTSVAQQSVMSAAGYTGLAVTPTAHLQPWGAVALSYDSEVVGGPNIGSTYSRYGTSGHNFVVGFGLLPFLEISGRMATNTIQTNCYTDNCGVRDLSFNFKGGISLDAENRLKIAVGASDFGGNANFFRTVYGVMTYSPENFDFSAGYARRSTALVGGATPLDGFFGSAAYRPWTLFQTQIEFDAKKAWTGVRLFAPSEWLPTGWAASVGANFRVYGDDKGAKSWVNFGLSIPLYKVPDTRRISTADSRLKLGNEVATASIDENSEIVYSSVREFTSSGLAASTSAIVSERLNSDLPSSATVALERSTQNVSNDELNNLAEDLRTKGFEDIHVGRTPDGAIAIKINNATYNVNTLDGLGVALGVIARRLDQYNSAYRLVITQRQIAVVGVVGQSNCLADWIAMKAPRCIAGTLHTPGTQDVSALVQDATWQVDGMSQSWKTARLIVEPVLRTAVATEYGSLDYSAGLRTIVQQPMWKGSYLEWSHVTPITESSDYKIGSVFGANRLTNGTDKALIHQVVRLPLEYLFGANNSQVASKWGATAMTAHAALGRINSNYRGAYGELRWEPFEGRHRFGVEGGRFERTTAYDFYLPSVARTGLASYRYAFSPTKTDFEIKGGQYLYGDRGGQFSVTQWFDDVALNLYIRRTKYQYDKDSRTFAGIELIIPLTPRKDMNPTAHLQVTGTPRWAYAIETKIGTTNYISNNQGILPGSAVLDNIFNSDRAGMEYFEQNMPRIRSAAAR